jgi:YHS domain-containing protein
MRTLIFIALFYLLWRFLKSWVTQKIPRNPSDAGGSVGEIDDIMIQDPYCNVYFPQRSGFHLNNNGEDLYFCSAECRDKFTLMLHKKHGD